MRMRRTEESETAPKPHPTLKFRIWVKIFCVWTNRRKGTEIG
jgi:hypothetical protein